MVMTYNLNRANDLIELFDNSNIVALKVYLDSSLGEENESYIFDFKTIEDYPENKRIEIRSLFNDKNLHKLSQVSKILKEFVFMKEADNVNLFELSFDIMTNEFKVQKSYKQTMPIGHVTGSRETYQETLATLNGYIASKDKLSLIIPEVYEKIPTNGRAKYIKLTIEDLLNKLKEVKIDD